MPRKRRLDGYLWLRRQAPHPRVSRIEMGVFRDYGHMFRLKHSDDLGMTEKLLFGFGERLVRDDGVIPMR